MKIGIDVSLLGGEWDGIAHYIYDVLKYMNTQSYGDTFYLYSDRPIIRELGLGDNFITTKDSGTSNHLLWLLTKLPYYIKRDKLDVFWQPNFIFPFRISGVRSVVTIHDMSAYAYSEYAPTKTNITHKLFLKSTCHKADVILTISQNCKTEMQKHLRVEEEKILTIYNGNRMFPNGLDASSKDVNLCLEKFGVRSGEYLLFVGTLSPRKNADVIVKGYFEYRRRGGKKKLILAGNIAAKSENVKSIVKESEFCDDVIMTGYISNLEKRIFYYNAAMLLYPSRLEGFGFPMLEAMQAKIPVITSNVSCMPEIAKDAAIYLNDINSWEELATIIQNVESLDNDKRKQLINRGLERIKFFENIHYQKLTYLAIRNGIKD